MKKTLILMAALLCSSFMFAWEWEKEGDTVTILPNEKSSVVTFSADAPWFNNEIESLHIVIGDGITGILENSFSGSSNIESVEFCSTLEVIGNEAFSGCTKLSNVTLPESLQKIGDKAFFDCPLLNNVIVPGTETEVGEDVFGSTTAVAEEEIASEDIDEGEKRIAVEDNRVLESEELLEPQLPISEEPLPVTEGNLIS